MEEHQTGHQQLLRLNSEVAALDIKVDAAKGEMVAATAEDREMYTNIYNNLVAKARQLDERRGVLEAQLAGMDLVY